MKFGKQIISPSYSRHADYNSLESENQIYEFECASCQQKVSLQFDSIIGKEFSWEQNFKTSTVEEIKNHFAMNIVGKSPDGGWPAIATIVCEHCPSTFLVYAGVQEIYNSVYSITIQGVVEFIND
jgi:hypothetical protein